MLVEWLLTIIPGSSERSCSQIYPGENINKHKHFLITNNIVYMIQCSL